MVLYLRIGWLNMGQTQRIPSYDHSRLDGNVHKGLYFRPMSVVTIQVCKKHCPPCCSCDSEFTGIRSSFRVEAKCQFVAPFEYVDHCHGIYCVRLQISIGPYRTKHGQAIHAKLMEEFILPAWTCSMCVNSLMNSARIA